MVERDSVARIIDTSETVRMIASLKAVALDVKAASGRMQETNVTLVTEKPIRRMQLGMGGGAVTSPLRPRFRCAFLDCREPRCSCARRCAGQLRMDSM